MPLIPVEAIPAEECRAVRAVFTDIDDTITSEGKLLAPAYEALWKLDTERPAAESIYLSKMISSTAYWEVCTLAHQVISGVSYSEEHAVSFHTRASRHLFNFLGEPSFHRQKLGQLLVAL